MRQDERVSLVLAASGTSVGGAERVVWELATGLPPERFDVRVWLPPARGVDELADSLAEREVPVDRVVAVDSRWDWRGMLATWSRLRRQRPGLLHIHHAVSGGDRRLAGVAQAAGVPHLVVTEHHATSDWLTAADRALMRRELQIADAVTTVTAGAAEALTRDYGIERERMRVIPGGADAPDDERERPVARRVRDDLGVGQFRPLWVCAGRLEEEKGHKVFLEALAILRSRNVDFVAVIVGEGSQRAALERMADQSGLGERVRFAGQVDVLGPVLLAADACVFPSLQDGLPLSLLEAMVRERPTVATRVGAIPEVIEDGITGRLVPPGDPAALAGVLQDFHARRDAAWHLGEAGAERVLAEFTWPRVVGAFEAVYDEVMGLASFTPDHAAHGAGARS